MVERAGGQAHGRRRAHLRAVRGLRGSPVPPRQPRGCRLRPVARGRRRREGLHARRHEAELRAASVCIVVAGMEGALPSVVGGLVGGPVFAVPTSIGYGASFNGLAALLAMLNSCAKGVAVVNIDNGFGAGTLAADSGPGSVGRHLQELDQRGITRAFEVRKHGVGGPATPERDAVAVRQLPRPQPAAPKLFVAGCRRSR